MRYTIVTETYPPEVNGVALTVQGLEQGLRERGHRVTLVRPAQADVPAQPHELLLRGARLPRYPGLQFGLPATTRLVRHWHRQRPDAVYVATEGPLGWSALRAARRLAIPVATGFHTRFDAYMADYGLPWLRPLALAWMRRVHNHADATLVPTAQLQAELAGLGFKRVQRLRRAVDTDLFTPERRDPALRAGWGLGEATLAVIHVGRIAAEKNLELTVRAFRRLQQRQPAARCIWVGDGPQRAALEASNPDFIFCGLQRGEALAQHFASADLFLFPSRSETFGNVTLEAMASGVPTIAFDSGAAHEHLRDSGGGATVADEAAFIEASIRLAEDPVLRRSMGRAARLAVARLHPGQVAADFDHLLAHLAQRHEVSRVAHAA